MKAAVLEALDTLTYRDIPTPVPAAGEVLVRVAYTGICGSDVPRVLAGAVHGYPIVLGHEFSGTVVEVGQGVEAGLVGKRISGVPLVPCGKCEACAHGWFSLCSGYGFVGSRRNGSMAEYVALPAENIIELSDSVTDVEGAFFEPATVAIHGIELARVEPGAKVAVVGGGTIGTLTTLALRGYGAPNAVVTRRSAAKFASLRSVGIERAVATGESGWKERAFEIAGCDGFDYVFDTAGSPETIQQALDLAGPRATVCFIGTPKRDVSFTVPEWERINRKELTLKGSWMSYSHPWPGVEWQRAEEMFANGILKITDEMIDHIYPLSHAREAFDRFKSPKSVQGKILICSREA